MTTHRLAFAATLLLLAGCGGDWMPRNEPQVPLLDASGYEVARVPASMVAGLQPGSPFTYNRPGARPEIVTVGLRPEGVSAGRVVGVRTDDWGIPVIERAGPGTGNLLPDSRPVFEGTEDGVPLITRDVYLR